MKKQKNKHTSIPLSITLDVTQLDIDNGEPGFGETCAIAQTVRRHFGKKGVNVDTDYISFTLGGWTLNYSVPAKARKFIEKFDEETEEGVHPKKVKPFTFEAKLLSVDSY